MSGQQTHSGAVKALNDPDLEKLMELYRSAQNKGNTTAVPTIVEAVQAHIQSRAMADQARRLAVVADLL